MSALWVRGAVALALTVLADLLLFGTSPGIGLALFALAAGGAVWARYGTRLLKGGPWLILWAIAALEEADDKEEQPVPPSCRA